MRVKYHHAIVPPVAHEELFTGDVIGECQRNLQCSRRDLSQLPCVGIRLTQDDVRHPVGDAILRVQLEHQHPIVVLIVNEESVIDRIQGYTSGVDEPVVDASVSRARVEVWLPFNIVVADHIKSRHPGRHLPRRHIHEQDPIPTGVARRYIQRVGFFIQERAWGVFVNLTGSPLGFFKIFLKQEGHGIGIIFDPVRVHVEHQCPVGHSPFIHHELLLTSIENHLPRC